MEDDARMHLRHLAEVLRCQHWSVQLDAEGAVLEVANPAIPGLRTKIECCHANGQMTYRWRKGSAIGFVSEVNEVADRVQHVLRGVEP